MDKLRMKSLDAVEGNVAKIAALFPHCVTERINKDGKPELAIDFDKLRAELSSDALDTGEERYQFTWPDKRAASRLANTPTDKTLRPDVDASVDFWNTKNLYIEGDNLDVLKVLRENYLGKVKMIYIDPPYNTGNDFVYSDNFAVSSEEWDGQSGAFDEDGNQVIDPMQRNTESNGRFHTDWLNMIYPRLKVARTLLADDGVMFISIDDNEKENLSKICDEIFGEDNFIASFPWRKRTAKTDVPFGISQDHEWIIAYAKSASFLGAIQGKERKYFETEDFPGRPWRVHDLTKQTTASERPNSFFTITNPKTGEKYHANPNATWRITVDTIEDYIAQNRIVFPGDYPFMRISKPVLRYWKEDDEAKAGENFGKIAVSTLLPESVGMSLDGTREITNLFEGKIFSFPKPSSLISFFCKICNDKSAIVLDFFSGSATTAHAVMKLNAEDGGHRKFIMVQLPEETDEKSEARKAGYETICQIGEERIRRAGKKVKEEAGLHGQDLDTGFRVLKLDSSNMEDVFYTPEDFNEAHLFNTVDNVKSDRTPLDLLFQVMPELDIELSAKIEEKEVNGKKVFFVDDTYLIATFDTEVNESTVTEIAKMRPQYFVMRDSSAANDNVLDNFEQIFRHYSPDTIRKIL
ncbi:site-specific DNA-methyltransferase [uncultured Muribaculum sp.]|uniref:site-specific DNA-methyltransferase n=1 Tax=uncultured Muribaculum sp. TaxID=1918613 RepID=UPI00272FFB35|nr:site-specific DNA-methyltransferase [uncultured Muribaculum sp.]